MKRRWALAYLGAAVWAAFAAWRLADRISGPTHRIEFVPVPAPPSADALASALFDRYGSVEEGQYRGGEEWRSDAIAVLARLHRYPNG